MNKAHTTGYVAPVGRYVPPVLFNPYTGEPRDARDIASDPKGMLIVPPGVQLAATNNAAVAPVAPPDPDAAVNEVMELVGTAMDSAMKAGELLLDSHEKFNAQFASAKSLKNPIEAKLRSLLAGVSAPAAQQKVGSYVAPSGELKPDVLVYSSPADARDALPQAQADARDAERWRESLSHVYSATKGNGQPIFGISLAPSESLYRSKLTSAAQFTKDIDAAIEAGKAQPCS
ncbi:hypothetical protein [Comamonas thiooxydans]|uniref:hypothetical protein n=1 Tax=Comamonas thiooxydans TaxID=363952 RepID=UPI001CCD4ECC|nr:hypothetical protein [Comamonas thiooxydans]UBQ44604.1 hypothetical protein LCH15_25980 [Comamonas thiooxydans]